MGDDDILVPNIMESLDTTDGTDFVCTISVQGHGDYPTEPTLENPEINVTGVEDEGQEKCMGVLCKMKSMRWTSLSDS